MIEFATKEPGGPEDFEGMFAPPFMPTYFAVKSRTDIKTDTLILAVDARFGDLDATEGSYVFFDAIRPEEAMQCTTPKAIYEQYHKKVRRACAEIMAARQRDCFAAVAGLME